MNIFCMMPPIPPTKRDTSTKRRRSRCFLIMAWVVCCHIIVMLMGNSCERRLQEYITLAEKANLKFAKLWDLGETGIIEFSLPQGTA